MGHAHESKVKMNSLVNMGSRVVGKYFEMQAKQYPACRCRQMQAEAWNMRVSCHPAQTAAIPAEKEAIKHGLKNVSTLEADKGMWGLRYGSELFVLFLMGAVVGKGSIYGYPIEGDGYPKEDHH